jgi:hypothetical protein
MKPKRNAASERCPAGYPQSHAPVTGKTKPLTFAFWCVAQIPSPLGTARLVCVIAMHRSTPHWGVLARFFPQRKRAKTHLLGLPGDAKPAELLRHRRILVRSLLRRELATQLEGAGIEQLRAEFVYLGPRGQAIQSCSTAWRRSARRQRQSAGRVCLEGMPAACAESAWRSTSRASCSRRHRVPWGAQEVVARTAEPDPPVLNSMCKRSDEAANVCCASKRVQSVALRSVCQ